MTISLFLMLTAIMAQRYEPETDALVTVLWFIALSAALTGH